jgi:hypothetical protein
MAKPKLTLEKPRRSYDVIAFVISLIALLLSGWQFFSDRDFRKRMARPELAFTTNMSPQGIKYDLANIGTGAALVQWFEVAVDQLPQKSWHTMFAALGETGTVPNVSYTLPEAIAWPPDAQKTILQVGRGSAADRVFANRSRLEMRVCYCSVLGACWISSSRGERKVKDVASCEPKPNLWFGHGKRDELRAADEGLMSSN